MTFTKRLRPDLHAMEDTNLSNQAVDRRRLSLENLSNRVSTPLRCNAAGTGEGTRVVCTARWKMTGGGVKM